MTNNLKKLMRGVLCGALFVSLVTSVMAMDKEGERDDERHNGRVQKLINRTDIFGLVTGRTIDDFNREISEQRTLPERKEYIRACLGAQGCEPGEFRKLSIGDLRNNHDEAMPFEGEALFNVVTYSFDTRTDVEARSQADIGAVQAQYARPYNQPKATIQLASRAHCLEGCSDRQEGNVNNIIGCHAVQGEEASIGSMPATVERMYGVTDAQSNLFGDLRIQLTQTGGIAYDDNNRVIFDRMAEAYRNRDCDPERYNVFIQSICVGIHGNAQVVTGFSNVNRVGIDRRSNDLDANVLVHPEKVFVNQVCAAALNLRGTYGRNPIFYSSNRENDEACAQMILDAMYEGTIRAAAMCDSQDILLTLVGGAAFLNDQLWIARSIRRMQDFIREKNLHVTVMYFHSGDLNEEAPAYVELMAMVGEIGGTIKHI